MAKKATNGKVLKGKKTSFILTKDDVDDRLNRAQAMAYVLADAAAGGLGVEEENVNHVCLAIAHEINQAKGLLDGYVKQSKA